jgi:hypothetical protein
MVEPLADGVLPGIDLSGKPGANPEWLADTRYHVA